MMAGAVKTLPTFTHVRALRPTSAYAIFVYSAARTLIHALKYEKMREHCFILYANIAKKIFNIYFRSFDMTLMRAPEEGYLITGELIIATLRHKTLVDLQSAYINIYADEFSYPSMKYQLQHRLLLQVLVKVT